MTTTTKQRINIIHESLQSMIQPGQVVELRILGMNGNTKRTDSGYFDDMEALAKFAAGYDGKGQCYVTPNPVDPDLLARSHNRVKEWAKDTSSDLHVCNRLWLLIDADPERISGISSTDEEHEAAIERIKTIVAYLSGRGWAEPIIADSGNGAHANYRIDLPNTPESTLLIRRCLMALSMQFTDDSVKLDTSVFNASRIWKLYGTKAIKGDDTEARPHRYAQIISKPDDLQVVSIDRLQSLASLIPDSDTKQESKATSTGAFDLESWMASHSITGQKKAVSYGNSWRLDKCYFSDAHTDGAYIIQFHNGAIDAGCSHNTCQSKTWQDFRAIFDGTKEERAAKKQADKPKQQTQAQPKKKESKNIKLIPASEWCADNYGGDPLEPKWKVTRTHDEVSETVQIKKFLDWRVVQVSEDKQEKMRFYAIEESADEVPETELFVESDDTPSGDTWVEQLRSLGYTFKLNLLEDTVEVNGQRLDDFTRSKIYLAMAQHKVAKTYVDDCINVLAAEKTYHPIKDYLNSLVWDGQDHLTAMLNHIRGDDRTITFPDGNIAQLHWLLIRRWLLGCVARAQDGDKEKAFKHQTPMLVIIGKQGLGKSSWVRWLCSGLGSEYHRESPLNPHAPDDIRSAVTKWLWEVSELGSSLRKGDRDGLKSFITQEWHTYRKPWGRSNITKATLANLIGTLNPETGFLDDPTGHRRFMPVHITAINRKYAEQVDVNQLWAQLVHLYKTGTSPELSKQERVALADTYTEHEVENPLQTYLQMYFTIEPGNADLKCFTAEIIQRLRAFDINISNNPKVAGKDINDVLAPMGLTREKMSIDGIKAWGWKGITPNNVQPARNHAF